MKKLGFYLGLLVLLAGCTTPQSPQSIPVVDAGSPLSKKPNILEETANTTQTDANTANALAVAEPIQAFPVDTTSTIVDLTNNSTPTVINTGIPLNNDLNATDKPLDGAVLALLNTAQAQQNAGKLDEAAASIERAQRIAPSEPRVLYSLAIVRLKQGDGAASEQLAKRALSYTSIDQVDLRANLWELIAQAREKQGDKSGAEQARQQKTVRL